MDIINWLSSHGSVGIAGIALFVSLLAYNFNRKSWRETYRPIVTARIATVASGNIAIALNVVVNNSGNRPAKNVRLLVNQNDLESALLSKDESLRSIIENCFYPPTIIPIIENGRSVHNAFGHLSEGQDSIWKVNSKLKIDILYENLEGRPFKHEIYLLLAGDEGFAGGLWSKRE